MKHQKYKSLSEVNTEQKGKHLRVWKSDFMVQSGCVKHSCRLFTTEYTRRNNSKHCSHKTRHARSSGEQGVLTKTVSENQISHYSVKRWTQKSILTALRLLILQHSPGVVIIHWQIQTWRLVLKSGLGNFQQNRLTCFQKLLQHLLTEKGTLQSKTKVYPDMASWLLFMQPWISVLLFAPLLPTGCAAAAMEIA